MTRSPLARLLVLSVSITILSACGGGGGDSAPSASFSVTPTTLTFSAASASSGPPASQVVTGTVTGTVEGTLFINIALGASVVSLPSYGVLINGSNSGEAEIIPAVPATLGPGSFTDTITIRACTTDTSCTTGQLGGSPRTVAVIYNINGVKAASTSLTFAYGDAPTSADLTKQIQLSGYPSTASWSATSDASWLIVPANGSLASGTGQLTASLDQAKIDALVNDTYNATIKMTPAAGDVVTIPVTLTVDRAEVSYVAPYVAVTGTSREVVIRGAHFPATPSVSFGGVPALNVNRVSDNEIRATYPAALTVGKQAVQVSGISRSLAALVVVNTPASPRRR